MFEVNIKIRIFNRLTIGKILLPKPKMALYLKRYINNDINR